MADDASNPGGYRPDDPRYGLSGQALQDYYLSRPAQFFIRAMYKPDSLHLREQAMDAHLAHVRAHREQIQFAGPLLSDDGATPIGTMCIIDASDRAAAEALVANEPMAAAGVFETIRITRWRYGRSLASDA